MVHIHAVCRCVTLNELYISLSGLHPCSLSVEMLSSIISLIWGSKADIGMMLDGQNTDNT